MAKKSGTNKILLIAAVAAVGYYFYKKSGTAVVPAPTTGTLSASAPTLGTGSASTPTASTLNDSRIPVIQQWINTLTPGNQAAANNALLAMSQAEIASLYDIVHNDFYGNGITTDAQRAFWDAWRPKYHVNDGTYK